MLYIIGTQVDTTQVTDPRSSVSQKRIATWLPELQDAQGNLTGGIWLLGRISQTKDANTLDYTFYLERNPQRTHTVVFTTAEQADQAISAARGEKIIDEPDRTHVNMEDKRNQVANDLNRKQANDPRRGGRPGSLGNRMGR